MKKLLTITLLCLIVRTGQGQTVPDLIRTIATPATGANANNRATVDANLYAAKNLRIPRGSSFSLNGAKDSIGYVMFNTTSNRFGVYVGGGTWQTYLVAADIPTTLAWTSITGKPTTIAGYGITDFNSLGDARWYSVTNPNGYISGYTETDPTVPAYSKTLTAFSVIKTSTDALYPALASSYTNPSWIASLPWSKITATPTTLAGYGITDGISLTYFNSNIGTSTAASIVTKEPLITTGTTLQYWRGDKTFQTLNTAVVPELTNLYYTDVRSRAALSFAAGSGGYNSTTGVITIPTNNNQITNGAGYGTGTVTSITPGYGFTSSTPITSTGTLTIDTASSITSKTYFNTRIGTANATALALIKKRVGLVVNPTLDASAYSLYTTTSSAATITYTSGGVTFSGGGGTGSITNYIVYNGYTSGSQNWLTRGILLPTADGSGYGVGLRGNLYCQFIATGADKGKIKIYNETTLKATSSNAISYTNGASQLEIIFSRAGFTFTASVRVVGSTTQYAVATWTASPTDYSPPFALSTFKPAFYMFGGGVTLQQHQYYVNDFIQSDISVFGDSNAAGMILANGVNGFAQQVIQRTPGGGQVIGGQGGSSYDYVTLRTEENSLKPRVAFWTLGTNDAYQNYTVAGVLANIQTFISDCYNNNVVPVISTVIPVGSSVTGVPGSNAAIKAKIDSLNTMIKALGIHYVDDYLLLGGASSGVNLNPLYDSGDGIHLNLAGHNARAQNDYQFLRYFVSMSSGGDVLSSGGLNQLALGINSIADFYNLFTGGSFTGSYSGGGKIVLSNGATLINPNIGAASGASLSTTGDIYSGGNLATGGQLTVAGNVNISASSIIGIATGAAIDYSPGAGSGSILGLWGNQSGDNYARQYSAANVKTWLSLSGTNTGDQTITLTGDVTGSGTGSFATAIGVGKVTNTMLAGSIDLTTKVTGVLPIANGGTGSGTKPFVDLTTNQTSIAGNKTFSGTLKVTSSPIIDRANSSAFSAIQLTTAGSNDWLIGLGATGAGTTSDYGIYSYGIGANVFNISKSTGLVTLNYGLTSGAVVNLKNYTVATLPAGTRGDIAYVTDALAPSFLVTVVGGGSVVAPVFYNGTNWVAQ